MGNCKNCGQEIIWKTPYVKGDGPLNQDGSPHRCKKQEKSPNAPEKVEWYKITDEEKTSDMKQLVLGLKLMQGLAYEYVKELHPDMPENTNTFGQIVNANISHLINLAKVKAIKESG